MKWSIVLMKEVFREDLDEFVNNGNMVFGCYPMELSNQSMYWIQENDRRHWKRLNWWLRFLRFHFDRELNDRFYENLEEDKILLLMVEIGFIKSSNNDNNCRWSIAIFKKLGSRFCTYHELELSISVEIFIFYCSPCSPWFTLDCQNRKLNRCPLWSG